MGIDLAATLLTPALSALIGALVAGAYGRVRSASGDAIKRDKAIADGMRNLMRDKIIDAYEAHVNRGMPMTVERKASIDSAYSVYHALGGNGTITHLYEALREESDIKTG